MSLIINKDRIKFLVFLIPVVNSIANVFLDRITLGSIHIGHFRAIYIVLVLIIYFSHFHKRAFTSIDKLIFVMLFYMIMLLPISSNISYSVEVFSKFFMASIVFIPFYHLIDSRSDVRAVSVMFILAVGVVLIDLLHSNIMGIGTQYYDRGEDALYWGRHKVNIAKYFIFTLFVLPLIFLYIKNKRWKYTGLLVLIVAFILSLLGMKRSAFLSIIIGFPLLMVLLPKNKIWFRSIIVVLLLYLVFFPIIEPQFEKRFEARGESMTIEGVQEEPRMSEVYFITSYIFDGNIRKFFIGTEIFNDRNYYGRGRMLHTDYMIMLSGTGVIGLSLYLLVSVFLLRTGLSYRFSQGIYDYRKFISSFLVVIVVSQLIISLSGLTNAINPRGAFMMIAATYIAILYKNINPFQDNSTLHPKKNINEEGGHFG